MTVNFIQRDYATPNSDTFLVCLYTNLNVRICMNFNDIAHKSNKPIYERHSMYIYKMSHAFVVYIYLYIEWFRSEILRDLKLCSHRRNKFIIA